MAQFTIGSGTTVSQAGTLSSSGTAVTGSGTAFTASFIGVPIVAAGQTLCVASVSDGTHLVLVTAPTVALSGATWETISMTNVETYSTPGQAPVADFLRWTTTRKTGDALERGLGRPSATWTFPNIDTLTFAGLQAFCSNKSARVYIRTLNDLRLSTYGTYRAAMIWPDDEGKYGNTNNMPFVIQFRDLVLL